MIGYVTLGTNNLPRAAAFYGVFDTQLAAADSKGRIKSVQCRGQGSTAGGNGV